jgi:mono/diheme cytochrome c family protein
MLFSYDIIKLRWVSFMAIQPSFKPMEHPLPVAEDSIPIEGAAYTLASGVPVNPVSADDVSLQRGTELYKVNCVPCHGAKGKGDGVIGTFFKFKPADLTSFDVQQIAIALFLVISNGVDGRIYAATKLQCYERWDLVNFIRTWAAAPTRHSGNWIMKRDFKSCMLYALFGLPIFLLLLSAPLPLQLWIFS